MYQIKVTEPTGEETSIILWYKKARDEIEGRLRAEGMKFETTITDVDRREIPERDRAMALIGMLLD